MNKEDRGLEKVDDNWPLPDDPASTGISRERVANYRQIFNEPKIPRGFYSFVNPTRIEFIASASGLSISGSSKGYAFLEHRPELAVENLDDYHSPDGIARSHIEQKRCGSRLIIFSCVFFNCKALK